MFIYLFIIVSLQSKQIGSIEYHEGNQYSAQLSIIQIFKPSGSLEMKYIQKRSIRSKKATFCLLIITPPVKCQILL